MDGLRAPSATRSGLADQHPARVGQRVDRAATRRPRPRRRGPSACARRRTGRPPVTTSGPRGQRPRRAGPQAVGEGDAARRPFTRARRAGPPESSARRLLAELELGQPGAARRVGRERPRPAPSPATRETGLGHRARDPQSRAGRGRGPRAATDGHGERRRAGRAARGGRRPSSPSPLRRGRRGSRPPADPSHAASRAWSSSPGCSVRRGGASSPRGDRAAGRRVRRSAGRATRPGRLDRRDGGARMSPRRRRPCCARRGATRCWAGDGARGPARRAPGRRRAGRGRGRPWRRAPWRRAGAGSTRAARRPRRRPESVARGADEVDARTA